jgi:hypothetical protein
MIVATRKAVFVLHNDGSRIRPNVLLDKLEIRRVVAGKKFIVVALEGGDLIILDMSQNEMRMLETGISDRIDSLCILNENPFDLIIGTTPPFLFRMNEEGPAKRIKSFDELKVRSKWYTPWGGPAAVRSIARSNDGWIYADIHVGSIMRSPDSGQTWKPVTPSLHKDVHEVATTPSSQRRVYANTYLSVYVSSDRGESWEHRSKDLNNRYGRGIAVNPEDPDVMLCGVSDGPTGANVNGQLYFTEDAGLSWIHITKGFPYSTRKNVDTFHIAFSNEDVAWVTDEEDLYISLDSGSTWSHYWKAPDEIIMLSYNQGDDYS